MTVEFVDDADVTNGTAGTSVVVARPGGTENGHVLVAFIGCVGNATISTPSGWTLLGTANPSALVRLNAFWKVASSEPASWTWTLGASQRNWGWVGAYSGVKTSAPIRASQSTGDATAGTGFASSPSIALATGGVGVSAVAAIRTASGAATTWTGSGQNERADLSTNAGAGTDIAGMVQDSVYTGTPVASYGPTWTASQSMTAGAMWAVTLEAAFVGYDGGTLRPIVEAAFGADPDGDPASWTWTDITAGAVDVGTPLVITTGRDDRGGIDEAPASTRVSFMLKDETGKYMPDNPNGLHYPNIVEDVPVRVRLPFGRVSPTTRATAFVDRWSPSWDETAETSFVSVAASGRLQRLRDESRPIHSVLYREIVGGFISGITPHAYYPCEDSSGATRVASALPGHQPLQVSGPVSFGSASDLGGSQPLPTLGVDGVLGGALGPGQTATGQWVVLAAIKLPETPAAVASRLMLAVCTGTAREWSLWMVPGSPHTLNIRAAHFGTSLVDDAVSIVEAEHYGKWRLYALGVTQNGADVDYQCWSLTSGDGVGKGGTLAGRTIGVAHTVRFVGTSSLDGMAIGHIAHYTDPSFDLTFDPPFIAAAALDGKVGDHPITRFSSLCGREGIPNEVVGTISGSTSIGMGPQPAARIGDLLQQAGDTDHGLVHDALPDGSVTLVTRSSLYNQDVTLTLDNGLGQVPASLRPTADGQSKITDSTVARDGGSSARYAAANARGGRPDEKTLSLENDQHLYEIAGWRVTLGGQTLRYTQVPLNLRASPELAEAWMNCSIGSRVKAINLPATHGPTEADGILVGWREEISADRWMVYMNLAPARPYDVPVLESGDPETTWRLDMEGSTLATAAGTSDTTLLVACSGDARWGTDVPYDLDVLGERMTATAIASSATDAFGRTSANGWGTADSGQAWTTANGSASDFAVSSGTGRITNNSTGVLRGVLLDIESLDVDFSVDLVFPNASAATAVYERWVIGRATDTSNHYGALLQLGTSGGALTLAAFKRVGGTFTNLASKSAGTNAAGNTWRATVRIVGEPGSTKLYVTAQNLTAGTPPVAVRVTDLDDATLTGTNIGVIDRRGTGNTDTGIVGQWDNLDVTMPQTFTVTRAVSGGADAKAHTAGETVRLWRARGLAL